MQFIFKVFFFAILGSQYFCMNYRTCLSISTKTSCQNFHKDLDESVDSFREISSVDKESTCNAGNPNLIPRSGRSAGEGIGYPCQYSWASLVAQLVKNPSAVSETWVRSLCWEDPLEKGKAIHSSILAWRIPWTVQTMGLQRVGRT